MAGVRFIRVHGRIVPIRDKTGAAQNDNNYGKFAAAGAVKHLVSLAGREKVAVSLFRGAPSVQLSFQKPKFAAVTAAVGLGILGANAYDSYKHADRNNSVLAGAGRFLGNAVMTFAGGIGTAVAISGGKGIVKHLKPKAVHSFSSTGDIVTTFRRLK